MKRKIFLVSWSILSFIGIFFQKFSSSFIGFFLLGFHTPRDSIFYFMIYGLFSQHAEMALVSIPILIIFLIFWIIALIKSAKSFLFEYLIVIDNFISLGMMSTYILLNPRQFTGWHIFAFLIAESILSLVVLILYKLKNKSSKNIIDEHLS